VKAAQKFGVTLKQAPRTQEQCDLIATAEAPDQAPVNALLLRIAKLDNLRGQTLRAFTAAEMAEILDMVNERKPPPTRVRRPSR
jgi:uncharacterized protein with GYD domain